MSPSTEHRENRELASEIKFVIPEPLAEQSASGRVNGSSRTRIQLPNWAMDITRRVCILIPSNSMSLPNADLTGGANIGFAGMGPTEVVFLERKLKTRELVSKRRAIVPLEQLQALETGTTEADWKARWFQQRLAVRRLKPVCQIGYRRSSASGGNPVWADTPDDGPRAEGAAHFRTRFCGRNRNVAAG